MTTMIPLLFLLSTVTPIPITVEPHDNPPLHICEELAYELNQAVEFDIITPDQATGVYIRCLVNYS